MWVQLVYVVLYPFTSGFFEEIIWRGFGIDSLEPIIGHRRANTVQSIAYSLWSSPTILNISTITSFVYAYLAGKIYAKYRILTPIIIGKMIALYSIASLIYVVCYI